MKINKKIILMLGGFLVVLLLICVVLLMIHVKKTNAIVLVDNLTCNYLDKITANDFIKEIDGTVMDSDLIDTSKLGKRRVTIKYKNRYGFVEQKKFEVEVKDRIAPTILIDDIYTISEGDDIDILDKVLCLDDYDDGIECTIIGEYNTNIIGQYPLNVSATDKSGNNATKSFTLEIVKKEEKNNSKELYTDFNDIYKIYKNNNTEIGLDISKWQGTVDFSKLAKAGVNFVMLKVGGQTEIDGEYIVDPKFYENIEAAQENNIKVGVYFYSYAKNENEARKQARWVYKIIKDYNVEYPVAFDWENWEKYSNFKLSIRTLNNIAKNFIEEINRYHYTGILYSSKKYLENIWYQDNYLKWIAYYTNNNTYNKDYLIWQQCSDGKIDGINGYVDINIMNKIEK